jgi:hypothetical protein
MQTIQSEICKQTAALVATMDSTSTSTIENLKSELRYENEKLPESLIARFESANAAIPEGFNAKLGSEIRVVSDMIDNVSRDADKENCHLEQCH